MFKEKTMVDIESLGMGSNATIISIGAVKFSQQGLGAEFYMQVLFDNSRNIDADTVRFWMNQGEDAKKVFQNAISPLDTVIREFDRFVGKDSEIWGNGSDFDNVILADAFKSLGLKWNHRANRCYRTLKSLHPGIEFKRIGVHHNALDDAKSQALHAIEILNYFLGRNMKFDIDELNRLIEEDLKERRAEKRLEMEIEDLEKDLDARSKELEILRKRQQIRGIETGAMKYFQEYLTHCEQTMALPKKVFATAEGGEHE